ncbi:MAG: DUF1616 domain-containing protein [Candidatus Altiarchaeota archaeon]|nr:DUF1616 domain-containing protein [Candidatus Altiarchaeota archaeon]
MVLEILVQAARAAGGLLLTLFIPGAAFILAMYPRKKDLDLVERIALSSVMSIAITLLTALFLDLVLGVDFTAVNVAVALIVFTGLCLAAWFIQTRGRF